MRASGAQTMEATTTDRCQCFPDSLPWYLCVSVSTLTASPILMNCATLMTRPHANRASFRTLVV
jgi:hypothetical protein